MAEHNPLAKLSAATTALAECSTLDEVKHILDIAEAARTYARAAKLGLEAQNHAAELKLRAERKAGELLQQLERSKGGDSRSFQPGMSVSEYATVLEDSNIPPVTAPLPGNQSNESASVSAPIRDHGTRQRNH